MATTDCTLGTRFAKSNFLAKTYTHHLTEPFSPSSSALLDPSTIDLSTVDPSTINLGILDETLAELMETLRLHVNVLLRLNVPVQKRSRLLRNYWEVEYLVKELRLLAGSGMG